VVSCSGTPPGSRCSPGISIHRPLSWPTTRTLAFSAVSATARSEGCVATQNGEWPKIARCSVSAPGAVAWQPEPGLRLLHGIVMS
jgi:hypothetical protein